MDFMTCPFEVKADNSNDGRITGYGSTFGNVDAAGDTVAKGAFKKSIADCKSGLAHWPSMFSNHSNDMPIGVWTDISEDDRGLKLSSKLAVNTRRGSTIYNLLKMTPRPALNGLSIGYRCTDYELHRNPRPGGARRTLKAVDLVEVSLVTFPADKFARVASVKSWGEIEVDDAALAQRWAAMEWQHMSRLAMLNGRTR
jgi:HK97 family phage prohead protease